ncbi:hypothetical protein B0H94_1182 [Salsuginibacillus halophilus]|uniref:Uncharacterized protein n=1 Tax=Salsuginibacillus halophilus TaxID=517424 RepID=A0A2P8H660_9BACI|nr:hypothetical protein [Salsuginibacillus halophilus]PSL41689.1 hypothetical protein B0H94_1182 [Salsuginibacillus halophilus]
MKKFEELNENNSTIVEVNGVEYRTVQDPYVGDDGDEYHATALDINNNEYLITWEVVHPETTDESEACDWKNPDEVRAL